MPKTSPEEPKEPKEIKEPKKPKAPKPKADNLPEVIEQGIRDGVQAILLWSPFGLAGYLVTQNQIAMAAIVAVFAFVARVIYAVWKNSTEGFIEGISITSRQWGEGAAKYLPEWLDDRFEDIQWRFSKVEKNYLDCLAEECLWVGTDGYIKDRVKDPTLEEVFVHLKVNSYGFDFKGKLTTAPLGSRCEESKEIVEEQLSIWDVLARSNEPSYRRVLINARGGQGKTTLLRHVAYTYGKKPAVPRRYKVDKFIPFLLYLRESKITDHIDLGLPALIAKHYLPALLAGRKLKFPPNWVENLLHKGKALIFLDGFDEVKKEQKSAMSEWIGEQMAAYPRSMFVLTSRPDGYEEGYTATEKPYKSITIEPFDEEQWQDFISKWYFCQMREKRSQAEKYIRVIKRQSIAKAQDVIAQIKRGSKELQEMVTNPLLLKMILTVYFYYYEEGELPQLQIKLYDDIFELVLENRPRSRGIAMPLRYEERRIVLQRLALDMMIDKGKSELDKETLLAKFTSYLQGFSIGAEEFLSRITGVSELLVEKNHNQYQFAHNKFRDYLAAKEIERCKTTNLLVEQGENSQWQDTTLFYVEIVENPGVILQELVDAGALDRAYNCLRRLDRKKYTPPVKTKLKDLEQQIRQLRYTKLEEYLMSGRWEEADELTYTVMIGVLGKEYGKWFEREELLNFPCEDLLKIDKLWVKSSCGHFGFSVQKEIYLSPQIGGIADGKYPGDKIWYAFCEEVGWREQGEWELPPSYTLDINTKIGTLPFFFIMNGVSFYIISLLSHRDL